MGRCRGCPPSRSSRLPASGRIVRSWRHQLSAEITVSSTSEDEADKLLSSIVTALRGRLSSAEAESDPIVLPDDSTALVELQGVRWATTAVDQASIIRAAAVGLAVSEVDEVGGRDE